MGPAVFFYFPDSMFWRQRIGVFFSISHSLLRKNLFPAKQSPSQKFDFYNTILNDFLRHDYRKECLKLVEENLFSESPLYIKWWIISSLVPHQRIIPLTDQILMSWVIVFLMDVHFATWGGSSPFAMGRREIK